MSIIKREVIIIGAGVAGLSAAQCLRQAGLSPLVLEARPRSGGRVWTDRCRGIVEFGAEFIHGQNAVTWEIVTNAGLTTIPWPPAELADTYEAYPFASQGAWLPPNPVFAEKTQYLYSLVEAYEGPVQSAADFIASLTSPADLAAKFALNRLACVEGADVARLNVQALGNERRLENAGWGADFHIRDGYDLVVTALAHGVDISLNTAVTEIHWNEAGATLFLSNGSSLEARYVILTVSLGVLQADAITFQPALPTTKQQAIQSLAMGPVAKLALWFERPFWSPFVYLSTDGMIMIWWPVYSEQGAVLMGYVGGPATLELTKLGQAGAVQQGLTELKCLFGPVVAQNYLKGFLVDWPGDPWTRGGYTYTPLGAGNARFELAQPLANTLFFAGEATSTNGHIATVHGAIETGRRAADEILALPLKRSGW
jgi:monoamine oxidase